jgi:hypothetical protein
MMTLCLSRAMATMVREEVNTAIQGAVFTSLQYKTYNAQYTDLITEGQQPPPSPSSSVFVAGSIYGRNWGR